MKKRLQPTSFKIYNASAGSGKTHTLVKEYLKIALSPSEDFKNILAITFTNKAVNEMKERILTSLFDFSLSDIPKRSQSLFQDLVLELNISVHRLQQKSGETLKLILHNYAYFDVSTIDKFTHRVIRTFAKDLKLPQNFEPVVETDLLLGEAVSRVVQKAGSDEQLTKVLSEFALEKIEDNRSWDIVFDLTKIGELLFKENHAANLEKLTSKKMEDFLGLKKIVSDRILSLKKEMIVVASETLETIEKNGLRFEDFPRQTLPNHFKKFIAEKFNPAGLYNNTLGENLKNGTILKKGIAPISSEFLELLSSTYFKLKDMVYDRSYLMNVYRNVVPLTVLNVIQQEVDAIGTERDQIPIFKFNQIISKEVKDQPAPFIYERLGEKYRHYFIDEFQDTSSSQWNNLIPLIDNALASEGGSLFLVGDVKQAIYRWRGGKAEQLLNLAREYENPFVVRPETKNLPTNYRSSDQLIAFNNAFFTWSSEHLENLVYQTMFRDGNKQEVNTKKGGFVSLHFIDKENEKDPQELYCEKVMAIVEELKHKNHPLEDITILVRSNSKGVLLADYLTQKNIPIISSESLLLNNSVKVRFLINLLQYAGGFKEKALAYEILAFLAPQNLERHWFVSSNLENLENFLLDNYNISLSRIERLSAFDSLEYAIRQFDLVPDSDAYIIFLMDFVLDVEQREGGGIQSFLTYWEKKKESLAIASPEDIDAVRIMTVHKAKGLEFPVVIFPFANEQIVSSRGKKMWVPTDSNLFNGFDRVLLNEKEELTQYSDEVSLLFSEEKQKMELDALNVLYVALTRAEKMLYIISEKKSGKSENQKIVRYSDLFVNYLKDINLWSDERSNYSFGILEENKIKQQTEEDNETLHYQYTYRDRPNFRIVTTAGMLWDATREDAIKHGTLIHYILGLIETKADLDKALETVLKNGDVSQNEIAIVRKDVTNVLQHPKLEEFFTDKYTVLNERDILTSTGNLLRPDRISIYDNQATLIDYKTGKKNPKHKEQVYSYADALEEMGFVVINKIIVYIDKEVTTEFI